MCDKHNEDLDHYCTEHALKLCPQCAAEDHSAAPCESVPLEAAAGALQARAEQAGDELKRLKVVSQSILDGDRQEFSLNTIQQAEAKFDRYVESMKQKFSLARRSVRPFAELSREELWKLKAVTTRRLPTTPATRSDADGEQLEEVVALMAEIRKQTKNAKDVLQALPNYVEVTVDQDFLESISFDGLPVHVTRNGEKEDDSACDVSDVMSAVTAEKESLYLIEKRQFALEKCVDMVLMEDYLIASVGDSVHKRELKQFAFRQGISVPGADKICVIGETTEIAVYQRVGFISIIQTASNLAMLYRLICTNPYFDISYLESVIGSGNVPPQSPVFVVCYTVEDYIPIDFVDLVQAKTTKYPGRPPKFLTNAKTLVDSSIGKNRTRFRGVTRVCALHGKHVLVGAGKSVTCLNKAGSLLWTIDLPHPVAQLLAHGRLVYACVQNEHQILTVSRQGHVLQDNILPVNDDVTPEKLNAYKDTLLVKVRGQSKWKFYKQMSDS